MLIIYHLGLILLLVKIAWLDYRQQLIADKDIITGLLWVFTWQLCYFQDAASSALGALYSAIIYGFYFAAIRYYTKKELYGAGDVTSLYPHNRQCFNRTCRTYHHFLQIAA